MAVGGPHPARTSAPAVVRPEPDSRAVAVAVLKRALEAQREDGRAVSEPAPPKGRFIDVRA